MAKAAFLKDKHEKKEVGLIKKLSSMHTGKGQSKGVGCGHASCAKVGKGCSLKVGKGSDVIRDDYERDPTSVDSIEMTRKIAPKPEYKNPETMIEDPEKKLGAGQSRRRVGTGQSRRVGKGNGPRSDADAGSKKFYNDIMPSDMKAGDDGSGGLTPSDVQKDRMRALGTGQSKKKRVGKGSGSPTGGDYNSDDQPWPAMEPERSTENKVFSGNESKKKITSELYPEADPKRNRPQMLGSGQAKKKKVGKGQGPMDMMGSSSMPMQGPPMAPPPGAGQTPPMDPSMDAQMQKLKSRLGIAPPAGGRGKPTSKVAGGKSKGPLPGMRRTPPKPPRPPGMMGGM